MSSEIHSTAIIGESAILGRNLQIGPYAIIENGAVLGDGCKIESHSVIKASTTLKDNVRVGHFAVVGGDPQHLSFDTQISSKVIIGANSRLGEGVTVHRSMYKDGKTEIGLNCFLMGNVHVGHDCSIGREVILANASLLGGHVQLSDFVFVGGGVGIHQFVRVGEGAMLGGMSEISADIAPHVTVVGRNRACGVNLVGMKRRKKTKAEMKEIRFLYRAFLMKAGNLRTRASKLLESNDGPQTNLGREFVQFFLTGDRNFARSSSQ